MQIEKNNYCFNIFGQIMHSNLQFQLQILLNFHSDYLQEVLKMWN